MGNRRTWCQSVFPSRSSRRQGLGEVIERGSDRWLTSSLCHCPRVWGHCLGLWHQSVDQSEVMVSQPAMQVGHLKKYLGEVFQVCISVCWSDNPAAKASSSNTPPTRPPHLLVLPKQFYSLVPKHSNMSLWAILIQSTVPTVVLQDSSSH